MIYFSKTTQINRSLLTSGTFLFWQQSQSGANQPDEEMELAEAFLEVYQDSGSGISGFKIWHLFITESHSMSEGLTKEFIPVARFKFSKWFKILSRLNIEIQIKLIPNMHFIFWGTCCVFSSKVCRPCCHCLVLYVGGSQLVGVHTFGYQAATQMYSTKLKMLAHFLSCLVNKLLN